MRHRRLSLTLSLMALGLLLVLQPVAPRLISGQQGSANTGQGRGQVANNGQGYGAAEDPCAGLELPPGKALGLQKRCQGGGSGGVGRGDFNGDGIADLAIGVPGEDINGIFNAGAVQVIYGSSTGLSATAGPGNQFWTEEGTGVGFGFVNATGNNFGASLAAGDFNGDRRSDLAIGIPFQTVNSVASTGAVIVLYGSDVGLTSSGGQFFFQGSTFHNILETAEVGDQFGKVLNWGDFNGDGFGDLAVGVNLEDVIGDDGNQGAVHIIYGSPDGLTGAGNQLWHQDSFGIEDFAEVGDNFGSSLAAGDFNGDLVDDLAVGAPLEHVGTIANAGPFAGAVNVIYGAPGIGLTAEGDQFLHQDSPGIADSAEDFDFFGTALAAGDFDGDGRDDLAISATNEDVTDSNGIVQGAAGAVNVIYGSSAGLTGTGDQFWTQNSQDVLDAAESRDFFGSSLAAGDFSGDGRDDLAIGVPFEDVGSAQDAGAVNVIYGTPSGLRATVTINGQTFLNNQFWTENNAHASGAAKTFDSFGTALSAWNFGKGAQADLAIGIPGEDIGSIGNAGAILVLYGRQVTSGGVTVGVLSATGHQVWTQDSPDILDQAEQGDNFGTMLY